MPDLIVDGAVSCVDVLIDFENRVGHRLIAGLEKFLHYSTVYFLSVYPPAMRAEFNHEFILVIFAPNEGHLKLRQSSILINLMSAPISPTT